MKSSSEASRDAAPAVESPGIAHPVVWRVIVRVALVLVAIGVLTVSAWLSVPFYPVPLTMQTLAVLLVGGLLGPRLGASAVAGYLAIGLMGAPVFHNGLGGVAVFGGPTGGYLVGFLPAAFLMGLAVRWAGITAGSGRDVSLASADGGSGDSRGDATGGRRKALAWQLAVLVAGSVMASVAIYVFGIPWLALYTDSNLAHALDVGAVPFLLGDALKAAVAIGAIRMGASPLAKRGLSPF